MPVIPIMDERGVCSFRSIEQCCAVQCALASQSVYRRLRCWSGVRHVLIRASRYHKKVGIHSLQSNWSWERRPRSFTLVVALKFSTTSSLVTLEGKPRVNDVQTLSQHLCVDTLNIKSLYLSLSSVYNYFVLICSRRFSINSE